MLVFLYNYHLLRFVPFIFPPPFLSRPNSFRSPLSLSLSAFRRSSHLSTNVNIDTRCKASNSFAFQCLFMCKPHFSLLALCFSSNTSIDSFVVPLQLLDDCQLSFILSSVQSLPSTFDIMQKLSLGWSIGLSTHRFSFRLDSEEKSFQLAFLLVPEAIVAYFGLISRLTWVVSPEFGSS